MARPGQKGAPSWLARVTWQLPRGPSWLPRLDAHEKARLCSAECRASDALLRTRDEELPTADRRVALPTGNRQYHIDLGPGELADYILLPGDPDRTPRIAALLDHVELERRHREFASVTGRYKGERVSVVSTGIGTDNVEIVVAEILAIVERPTFIRVGSCGALQEEIGLGDLAEPYDSRRPRASSSMTGTRRSPTMRRSSRSSKRRSGWDTGLMSV